MFVVTFYSYKGGVGRTLALVNCAFRLAKKGKRVFILDFDLEAPGVDGFPLCGDRSPRQGIVEYVSHFTAEGNVKSLNDYVCQVNPDETQPGEIRFMSAGRKDEHYQILLSRLDWKYFYQRQKGYLFVENLKAAIAVNFAPDYVLVDSRTGLTDISGICTLQLPDLVVLLFNLNNQNVHGIAQIYRSIKLNRLHKDIKSLVVASPIPDIPDYFKIRRERLEYAQKTIGTDPIDLVIPFDPFVTFEETIVSGGEKGTHLGRSYDELARRIVLTNKEDVLTMLEEASDLVDEGDIERADLKYRDITEFYPEEPRAFLDYGRFLRIRGKKEAIKYLEKARTLDPQNPDLISQLIRTHLASGQVAKATSYLDDFIFSSNDADELESIGSIFSAKGAIAPAIRLYEKAIKVSETPAVGPRLELGNIYMQMKKYDLAAQEYEIVKDLEPASLPCIYNLGYALSLAGDPRALQCFASAISLFEQENVKEYDASGKANLFQAISHAYAGIGKDKKALELLESAIQAAKRLGPKRQVFSSVQYKNVTPKQFITESHRLVKAIRRKQR